MTIGRDIAAIPRNGPDTCLAHKLALAASLIILTLFVIGLQTPAHGQTRIEALVNNNPITSFDVQQRARLIEVTGGIGRPRAQQMALQELVDEELQLGEARRLGISVSDSEVNERLGGMASRVNMSLSGLTQAFGQMGVDIDTLRRRIRADLAWGQIVRRQFRQEVRVREQDVLMALEERENRGMETTTEFNLQQVVFFTVRGTTTAQGRANAETFRSRFTGCESTPAIVAELSGGAFKNIGRSVLEELNEPIRSAVVDVPSGGTSAPIVGDESVTVFAVCSRREIEDDGVARAEIQSELLNEEGQRLARRLLMDVRQRSTIEYR